ncbi:MAG: hypothetical protein WCZ23_05005 [Rhodospirillaceae bacterium]
MNKFIENDIVRLLVPVQAYTEEGRECELLPGLEGIVILATEAHPGVQFAEFPVDVIDENGAVDEWPDYAEVKLTDDQLELVRRP